jgi:hypothetical protein
MGFFGMLFWIAIFWLAYRVFRGRSGCRRRWADRLEERSNVGADQQSYIDALETRVAELEERLDFTERLVAGRQQSVASH